MQKMKRQRVRIEKHELREILFWAAYGVGKAHRGSYADTIRPVVKKLAKHIHFQLDVPEFGKYL